MYTHKDFLTKKALKDAVARWNELHVHGELSYRQKHGLMPSMIGSIRPTDLNQMPTPVTYYQPNDMGFAPLPRDGIIYVEGPHYPKPHKWYAQCEVKDGHIVRIIK